MVTADLEGGMERARKGSRQKSSLIALLNNASFSMSVTYMLSLYVGGDDYIPCVCWIEVCLCNNYH